MLIFFLQEYDYSLDMWSFGCMLASMVRLLSVDNNGAQVCEQATFC